MAQMKNVIESKYNTVVEKLERRWTDFITFEGNYVDELSTILAIKLCFLCYPTN